MTTAQIKYVRGLLAKNGIMDMKEQLVSQYTNGRSTDLSDMNYQETQELINNLKGDDKRGRMVRKMLSMAHEMLWETPEGKADMERINAWCEKYTEQHKKLDDLKTDELPAVVTTFTKVYKSFLKGI